MGEIRKLSAQQFRASRQDPACCVIDVRDRHEYAAGSEVTACLPLGEINSETVAGFVRDHRLAPDTTVVLLCARGLRASQAAHTLQTLIPNPIAVVDRGRAALLVAAGQPMSIERQVRIAAGALVLLGIVASVLLHPAFLLLSGFVGCGLVFAGITDWCGLGLLMQKLPWNRTNTPASGG